MSAVLSLRDLRTYVMDKEPPVKAVDGVTLEIQKGEMLCLVGESGCGKTMLALSIGGLLPPAARVVGGTVRLEGRAGYVFQDPLSSLNPVMSIGEQVLEPLQLHQGLRGAQARARALSLLEQVQIPLAEQRLRQYPHQLSGGMRQRVMIAMALACSPALLIADEPTTALDVTTQQEMLQLINRLKRELSMAVLLITHDLHAVAPVSDRTAVMYAGRIVEEAATPALFKNPSHPYTEALLHCMPVPGKGPQSFRSIPGSVPDLRFTPSGCPFHPRCPEKVARCETDPPRLLPLRSGAAGHRVSCWQRETSGG